MYVIKHVPEDFIVDEVSSVQFRDRGRFVYFKLEKRDCSTAYALHLISKVFGVPLNSLGFAGNKDRRAVTSQVCSAKNISREKIDSVAIPGVKLSFLGYGSEPVFVGALKGNNFEITVRNIESMPDITSKFRNLFGEQRFSSKNAVIGKLIIKKQFQDAAKLIAETNPSLGRKEFLDAFEYVHFLRSVPKINLLLFIHAYQSFLWNKAALITDDASLPIVGFGTENIDEVTEQVLKDENIVLSDFIIRELPDLSPEGSVRKVFVEAENLAVSELLDDEFFIGRKKIVLKFFLPKGCYATEFIRQLFQSQ